MSKDKDAKRLSAKLELLLGELNDFTEFIKTVNPEETDPFIWEQLAFRMDQIKLIPAEYRALSADAAVISLDNENIQSFTDFQSNYFRAAAQASLLLKNKDIKERQNISDQSGSGLNPSFANNKSNAKLPVLNIPVFSGHYTDWCSFHESFSALVDNNPKLSEVEKFYYLLNSLKNSAKDIVQELGATAANYQIALNMLKERYHNEKLIIFSHLEAIFETQKVSKGSSVELRKLHDNITRHLRALDNFNLSDQQFKAAVIAYIVRAKVDPLTASEYSKFKVKNVPTIEETRKFLTSRCEILEDVSSNSSKLHTNQVGNPHNKNKLQYNKDNIKQSFMIGSNSDNYSCVLCKENHWLYACPKFLSFTVQQRFDKANELKICKNCLRHSNHTRCTSKSKCKYCQRAHHSLLCFSKRCNPEPTPNFNAVQSNDCSAASSSHQGSSNISHSETTLACASVHSGQVLLSTAMVKVRASGNKWVSARCLLDSGSQSNFVSSDLLSKLNCAPTPVNVSVIGINASTSQLTGAVKIKIASLHNNFETELCCLVIKKITENLPIRSFSNSHIVIPTNIKLADDKFHKSAPVDILLGASHFYSLMCLGQISLGNNKPILQKTLLGWVISGTFVSGPNHSIINSKVVYTNCSVSNSLNSDEKLHHSVSKFWQTERVEPMNKLSLLSREEKFCETHFAETISQDQHGKFVVSIPFNSKLSQLGNSKQRALDRFYSLEKKLFKDEFLRTEYSKFIWEYVELGHATKISSENEETSTNNGRVVISTLDGDVCINNIPRFYLPHHAIIKSGSLTTKLRVVFDGSAKSDTNISINDTQNVGPMLQDDLFSILLRFRQHKIALTGDCEKMYRMINIHPQLRKFQCIFWRDRPNDPIDVYQLNTVTYGTASASYLATKCLQHLADQYHEKYPKSSNVLRSCFYMDDLLYTAETVQEILQVKNELTQILSSVGIPLRKFLSNASEVLESASNSDASLLSIPLGERSNAKALGLSWNALSDTIHYSISFKSTGPSNTKRTILSTVSQCFDPLGLLSPVIITGKILIQKLWELNLTWDESVPHLINSEWNLFQNQLTILRDLQIPRCVIPISASQVELHGFSDSSSNAYGACIYVRCRNGTQCSSRLLCSKSRVAPLRVISIPRLELCAAVLLAELMQKVTSSLAVDSSKVFLWTDSTVVLNWLNAAANKYKTFIANRIATVQEIFDGSFWHHVKSEENPADLVSRGISASKILVNSLWWNGPEFLSSTDEFWKSTYFSPDLETLEYKSSFTAAVQPNSSAEKFELFEKFSSFSKLHRVLAYVNRFISNCKVSLAFRMFGSLTTGELQHSSNMLVKICQRESFPDEIKQLLSKDKLKAKSNILSLNPFLDEFQLLRVGGRIKHSSYKFEKKHPLLLPSNHALTRLIMKHYHITLLHCGPQQLLSCVREMYWPISGKGCAKLTIRNCIKCFKVDPVSNNPLMGDLPAERLEANAPVFHNTGLDYAGPILIKDKKTRGCKLIKAYICLFVCLVTKAVHLELVTDLSTDAFLAVLKRFIGRRGKPHTLFSDNAKNFVGANNQLKDWYTFLQYPDTQDSIISNLSQQGIQWKFIIPRAPHQGGMWESGIKSTKFHLKRILGNTNLTYEDFNTVLIQVESVLNSRPLSSMSSDPNDLNPLTSGHFLIGRSFQTMPEPCLLDLQENRMSLYQRAQLLVQHFWKRWSVEVVPDLQRRTKWFQHMEDLLKIDSLVLIQEDNLPPLSWSLGRVVEIHRAPDGIIRSATVRVSSGKTLKRVVHKLCVLPVS